MSVVHAVVHVLLNHSFTHSLEAATSAPFRCSELSSLFIVVKQNPLTAVNWNPTLIIYSNLHSAVGTKF